MDEALQPQIIHFSQTVLCDIATLPTCLNVLWEQEKVDKEGMDNILA